MLLRKALFILSGTIMLVSCKKEKTEETSTSNTVEPVNSVDKFISVNHRNKALILAEGLTLYNTDRSEKGKAAGLYGIIVDIDSISQKRFALTKTDDKCLEHNFVHMSHPKIKGWAYGENVFEYLHDSRDTTFTIDGTNFKLYATRNFAIGVSDEDGLTFCGDMNPVVLYNSKYNTEAFIPIAPDSDYNTNCMVLDSFDGWGDKIKDVKLSGDTLTFTIHREYQEGSDDFVIEVQLHEGGYSGKIISPVKD